MPISHWSRGGSGLAQCRVEHGSLRSNAGVIISMLEILPLSTLERRVFNTVSEALNARTGVRTTRQYSHRTIYRCTHDALRRVLMGDIRLRAPRRDAVARRSASVRSSPGQSSAANSLATREGVVQEGSESAAASSAALQPQHTRKLHVARGDEYTMIQWTSAG
jgi:hypothetical protein